MNTIAEQLVTLIAVATPNGHGWIDDFGVVLAAAGIAVWIFNYLRLPVLFGYILAGVLVGPYLFSKPLVDDALAIQQISELGVIFLLFFIGMEFDLKRLKAVLGPASLALIFQTVTVLYIAQILSSFLGWNATSTLFFGSLLAISSSMVTIRVLSDQKKLQDAHAQYAVGILILEDILAVLLLVILTGVAVTKDLDWDAAWLVTFFMGVFVVVVFLVGRSFIPRILFSFGGDIEKEDNAEAITVMSVGLVMGVSILALKLNFSPALGAFIAGTLLSQTAVARRVEHVNQSLHDVFAAVFFVAIGMQLDPHQLWDNLLWIVVIGILVILGKIFSCWLGLCLSGQNSRIAYRAASAKAQIGEFSFIIASLGVSLGVLDEKTAGIAFGVALFTIMLTPPINKHADLIFNQLVKVTPTGLKTFFDAYRKLIEGIFSSLGRVQIFKMIKRPILQIVLYFFLLNGLLFTASMGAGYLAVWIDESPFSAVFRVSYWMVMGLIFMPFVLAVIRNLNAIAYILTDVLFIDLPNRPIYQGRLRQVLNIGVFVLTVFLLGILFLYVSSRHLPDGLSGGLAFLLVITIAFFLRRTLIKLNSRMEILFIESFRDEVDNLEANRQNSLLDKVHENTPWPVDIRELIIPENSAASGSRIKDLDLRKRFGVNILAIGRGVEIAYDPGPESPLFTGDRLVLLGGDEGTEAARQFLGQKIISKTDTDRGVFKMDRVYLSAKSILDGETLSGLSLRQKYSVTVIGIQRGETQIENPSPSEILHAGDILLVAGTVRRIREFAQVSNPDKEE